MKLRAYTVGDVFTFVDILSSISGSAGNELRSLFKSGNEKEASDEEAEDRGIELVLYVLNRAYMRCKDEVISFFASLLEMSVEEFLKQPPETVLDVIDEIGSRQESKDFFSRALRLFSKKGVS